MAEAFLYGYSADPEFPFHEMAQRLEWLGPILSAAETDHTEFGPLIDTVLVFCGARTAALHNIAYLEPASRCIDRLNASLSPAELADFRIEIVRRARRQGFITRTQSPRFDWSVRPTHLQTGRNLDFFAAGHIWRPPLPERAVIDVVEKHTLNFSANSFLRIGSTTPTITTN